jgi:hypothetical protein
MTDYFICKIKKPLRCWRNGLLKRSKSRSIFLANQAETLLAFLIYRAWIL